VARPATLGGRELGFRDRGVLFGKTGGAASQSFWNDDYLKQAGVAAFRGAAFDVRDIAKARCTSKRVRDRISASFFSGGATTGLDIAGILRAGHFTAPMLEQGTKAHDIAPRASLATVLKKRQRRKGRVAMKFPDGGFARGIVRHPGTRAQPFMQPAAEAFPTAFVRQLARRL
jgi:hypothetical protein